MEKEEQQKKENIFDELSKEIIEIDDELNRRVLCEDYIKKKLEKLIDKCGNKEMAVFLYRCKLHSKYKDNYYIRWISFNEFRNVECLGKGDFGEVHKATLLDYNTRMKEYQEEYVLLKCVYNSDDILKEVYIH